jgi:hypothetical protein
MKVAPPMVAPVTFVNDKPESKLPMAVKPVLETPTKLPLIVSPVTPTILIPFSPPALPFPDTMLRSTALLPPITQLFELLMYIPCPRFAIFVVPATSVPM